jgi:hypothetical protein
MEAMTWAAEKANMELWGNWKQLPVKSKFVSIVQDADGEFAVLYYEPDPRDDISVGRSAFVIEPKFIGEMMTAMEQHKPQAEISTSGVAPIKKDVWICSACGSSNTDIDPVYDGISEGAVRTAPQDDDEDDDDFDDLDMMTPLDVPRQD